MAWIFAEGANQELQAVVERRYLELEEAVAWDLAKGASRAPRA